MLALIAFIFSDPLKNQLGVLQMSQQIQKCDMCLPYFSLQL